jgi:hypothetical protein
MGWKFSAQGVHTGFYARGKEWCVVSVASKDAKVLAYGELTDPLNWVTDIHRQLFRRGITLPK